MIILVDMDGVTADFERGVLEGYKNAHPDKPFIPLEQRTTFYVKNQYPPKLRPLVERIYLSQGFYLGLSPIKGALEALSELLERGDQVYITTSPLLENPFCIQEKYDWVIKYLGKDWAKRMIVTKDKTIIPGDYLIDDKPEVEGNQQPSWEHILFSQPYNRDTTNKRRLNDWSNWSQFLR